jgi:hypothetical protein
MASPIAVPITPITLTNKENRRYVIKFQNTGAFPVYIVKQLPNGTIPVPSATVYDYIIPAVSVTDTDGNVVEIQTTARFDGIAVGGASTLAIMKTFLIR